MIELHGITVYGGEIDAEVDNKLSHNSLVVSISNMMASLPDHTVYTRFMNNEYRLLFINKLRLSFDADYLFKYIYVKGKYV